jgi:UDP-N-acetylmuramoyl-tripeptide--D-alanyl-D-alanine ligase
MKTILERILRWYARQVLRMYEPTVVAVTGSVGKTSAKDAIAAVCGVRATVRKSIKNYNNELGVPLTILGLPSAGRSVFGWAWILVRANMRLFFRFGVPPSVLVLEMGAEKPGDIAYLLDFVPVHIGVLTAVAPAHTEFFGSIDGVFREKRILCDRVRHGGTIVVNGDDERARTITPRDGVRRVTYGFTNDVAVRCARSEYLYRGSESPVGQTFTIESNGASMQIPLTGVVGAHHAYTILAAYAVGESLGLTPEEIRTGLALYEPPPGRMRLLAGIKHSTLIDDTYNSSPAALQKALDAIKEFPGAQRRIACLGTMAELGGRSDGDHKEAGRAVVESGVNLLVTVGDGGRIIAEEAKDTGMPDAAIASFHDAAAAGRHIQKIMEHGDLILLKGSQVVRMERIVKEVMAEPERASALLVRQGPEWQQ